MTWLLITEFVYFQILGFKMAAIWYFFNSIHKYRHAQYSEMNIPFKLPNYPTFTWDWFGLPVAIETYFTNISCEKHLGDSENNKRPVS